MTDTTDIRPEGVADGFTGWAPEQAKPPSAKHSLYPAHLIEWAHCPPFTEIHVSELARLARPIYISATSEHAAFYAVGLHVATEQQRADILRLERDDA